MDYFINIHTHTKPKLTNEIAIRNAFLYHLNYTKLSYKVSIGVHPWFAKNQNYFDELIKIGSNKNVVAIGECGLDLVRGQDLKTQEYVFEQHISAANYLGKPLILHTVKAYHLLHKFIKQSIVPLILHAYNGSPQQTIELLKFKNIYFSLGSAILKNNTEYIKTIPIDKLFFETDNKNICIDKIYKHAAKAFNIELLKLQHLIFKNYSLIFNIS
ncbi:MAG: TatD family hydrolase [Bacteroidia bacterium]